MTRLSLSWAFGAVMLVVGCRVQKPPTVVPEQPRIEAFTASATTLNAPGMVTLSWSTAAATRVQLSRAGQDALSVPEDQVSGSFVVQVERSTIFVLVARGEGGSEARAVSVQVAGESSPLTLLALPTVVAGGDTATLAWTAPGAQSLTLMAGTSPVDTRGQLTSGAVVVRPLRDTVYTLSDGTRSATASISVDVALLSVDVTPAAAQVGDNLTVSWTSAGADRVVIESPGRGQLAEFTEPAVVAAGNFVDVVPPLPSDGLLVYEVSAFKGTTKRSRTFTAFIGSQLAIVRFDAPEVARAGQQVFVRWTTVAADRVEVLVEGQPLYQTPSVQLAAQGGFTFVAPDDDFEVQVVAFNNRGDRVTQTAQVDAVGVPTSATLTATPSTVAVGAPVTLTYAGSEVRHLRITDSEGMAVFSITGQAAESGTAIVYPTRTTTYTLSADNRLGDPAVTATAVVTVTGAAPTVAQHPATALSGQLVELRPSVAGSLLYGFPQQTVLTSTSSNFIDISNTGLRVIEMGGNVTSVTPDFSTRLWGELRTGPLTISRCGWMAWGAPLVVGTANINLPSFDADAVPGIIAPYWDDLRLVETSAVLMEVVGEAPEQRLIVQWNKLEIGTDNDSLVTFQVQVHQAGLVSFHYQTMIPNASPTYDIGLQDSTRQLGYDLAGAAPPESNSAFYFFSPLSVPPVARVLSGTSWGGFIKTGTSYSFVGQRSAAVRLSQEIGLSELMFRPAPSVTAGQFLEAVNFTTTPYDLSGWLLRSNDGSVFTVPNGTVLPANGRLRVGASVDAAENDDAGVTVSWAGSGFSLGVDAGTLFIGTTDAGELVSYVGPADAGRGASRELDPGPFLLASTAVSPAACWATQPFGAQVPPQLGSPDGVPGCGFAYMRQGVANHFHDISDGGTVILASATNVTDTIYPVTLAPLPTDPAPVLFGARRPTLSVGLHGWLSPRTITGGTTIGGRTTPSFTSEPYGTIAPFWDTLVAIGNVSKIQWKKIEPNEDPLAPGRHWIVQWTKMSTDAAVATPDELTFQVKLFEDGAIEYHYREMRSGTSALYADGNSATVWLEEPLGGRALLISNNTRALRANTAIRFVAR